MTRARVNSNKFIAAMLWKRLTLSVFGLAAMTTVAGGVGESHKSQVGGKVKVDV